MVAQQRGYRTVFVVPDKVNETKRAVLRAYGAEVVVTPTDVEPDLDGDGGFDAVGHMVELDERGVADEFGKRVVDCHGSVPCVVGGRLVRTGVVRKTAPRESRVQTMALRWGAAARRYITVAFRQSGVG